MNDAHTLTTALGGRWYGGYGVAPCPVCQPDARHDQTALGLADGRSGRLLLTCRKAGCTFADILAAANIGPGSCAKPYPAERPRLETERRADAAKRERQAERCWREAQPIEGTPAERYFRDARAITCPLPPSLRFHPEAWHGATATRHPAVVALVEGGDGFAVHRTYLRPDGSGKAALDPAKAMLGAVSGGTVRLTEAPGTLAVAEGIETALALSSGLLRRPATVWAALSTSGLRGLRLPPEVGRLIIAPDGDNAGRAAAQSLAERANATGWAVSLLPAPEGRDWNDILILKGETA